MPSYTSENIEVASPGQVRHPDVVNFRSCFSYLPIAIQVQIGCTLAMKMNPSTYLMSPLLQSSFETICVVGLKIMKQNEQNQHSTVYRKLIYLRSYILEHFGRIRRSRKRMEGISSPCLNILTHSFYSHLKELYIFLAASGSNPKHIIYSFFNLYYQNCDL